VRETAWFAHALALFDFAAADATGDIQEASDGINAMLREALDGLSQHARQLLRAATSGRSDNLAPGIESGLLDELTSSVAPILSSGIRQLERARRSRAEEGMARPQLPLPVLLDLLSTNPLLARMTATQLTQWVVGSATLLERLDADRAILAESLDLDPVDDVSAITNTGSDRHNGGQTVRLVAFGSGARVVYKPRGLGIERGFELFVNALNALDPPTRLRAPAIIDCGDYGWAEFIAAAPCCSSDEIETFFYRSGALLALLHALVGTDVHQENLIASGAMPVPVDLEMLLQPWSTAHGDEPAEFEAHHAALELLHNSVLVVGLLPTFSLTPSGRAKPLGGLNEPLGSKERSGLSARLLKRTVNLPTLDGKEQHPWEFGDAIEHGFADYAGFLFRHRRTICDELLPTIMGDRQVRKPNRPTRFYSLFLRRLIGSLNVADGLAWSAQLDGLRDFEGWADGLAIKQDVFALECTALAALDVPRICLSADRPLLTTDRGIIEVDLIVPGLQRSVERLNALNTREVDRQLGLVRACVGSPTMRDHARQPPFAGDPADASARDTLFRDEVARLATIFQDRAIVREQSSTWISQQWLRGGAVGTLAPLDLDLYGGSLGVALFLASAGRVLDVDFHEHVGRALSRLRRIIASTRAERLPRSIGLGAGVGVGSILYGLCVLSEITGDEAWALSALALAKNAPDWSAAPRQLDAIGGAAGYILGLLKLYSRYPDDAFLDRAVTLGQRLLDALSADTVDARFQSDHGIAHGAAGLCLALRRLGNTAASSTFRDTIQVLEFKVARFFERGSVPRANWCRGSAGIGLVLLETDNEGDTQLARSLHEHAVDLARHPFSGKDDSLCCGAVGVNEYVRVAADHFADRDLRTNADIGLASIVTEARHRGSYRWPSGDNGQNLSFFRGVAGIGYTLVRRLDPRFPNVVIWQ